MTVKILASVIALSLVTAACEREPDQNNYSDQDVGHNTVIEYGRVKSQRVVDITGTNTGLGATGGAVAGGIGGATIGSGNGSLLGLLGGAIIGGVAGSFTEQSIKDRQGIEYIITFYRSGETRSIVQNIAKTDQPIANGTCVMVQVNSTYQRILPAPQSDEACGQLPRDVQR